METHSNERAEGPLDYCTRSRYLNLVIVLSIVRHSHSPQGHSGKCCHHPRLFPECHPFVHFNHPLDIYPFESCLHPFPGDPISTPPPPPPMFGLLNV